MHALILTAVLVYAGGPTQAKDPAARRAAERSLVEALQASGAEPLAGEELIERAQAAHRAGWVKEGELAFFAETERLGAEAQRALDRVELDEARATYAQVEQLLAGELRWPGAAARMSEAALERGVALFELKRTDEAQAAWQRAVALDPSAQLTEARVRPDVVRAFRAATAAKRTASVRVEVVPDGAEVQLGQGPLQPAPVERELPAGEVLVRAAAPGRLPAAALASTSASPIRLELAPDELAASLERLRERPDAAGLRALGESLGVEDVMVAAVGVDAGQPVIVARRWRPGGCASELVSLHASSIELAAKQAVDRLRALPERDCARPEATAVLQAQPIAHPRAPAPLGPSVAEHHRRLRWYQQPWLYAGLLAVTAGTVGLAVGLQPSRTDVHATLNGTAFSH